MINAVLFDMDGLLFDTETIYQQVQEEMSAKRGFTLDKDFKKTLVGGSSRRVMNALKAYWNSDDDVEDLLREEEVAMCAHYEGYVAKMRGVDELLRYLNEKGIRKCLGTSTFSTMVNTLVDKHNLRNEFEFIVTGDMVTALKPSPDIYLKCTELLGLDPSRCLVLEDSFPGMSAGVAAGCRTCAVPNVFTMEADFSRADLIVDSLAAPDLYRFIEEA